MIFEATLTVHGLRWGGGEGGVFQRSPKNLVQIP